MSDEIENSSESTPASEPAPRSRRVSTPRVKKKTAKSAAAKTEELPESAAPAPEAVIDPAPVEAPASVEPAPTSPVEEPAPVEQTADEEGDDGDDEAADPSSEWPEPEAASTGGSAGQSESGKRKRRRRKGKGGAGNGQGAQVSGGGAQPASSEEGRPNPPVENSQDNRPPRPPQQVAQQLSQPRPRLDPEQHAKMAWKIYLAEVSEEGVALIGDNDAKDLARRCFRLAEIFMEEQSRRR